MDDSARLAVVHELLEDVHAAVFGNGRSGLIERVTKLETKVALAGVIGGVLAGGAITVVNGLF